MKIIIISFILVLLTISIGCNSGKKEDLSSLEIAVEKKLQTAIQLFESDGLKVAVNYCEKKDTITIRNKTFTINCAVATNLYKPEEDVVKVSGNEMILPISLYMGLDNRSIGYLDEGYLFRDTTISAFAWGEREINPIIRKCRDFK